jgi:hypothetical protein
LLRFAGSLALAGRELARNDGREQEEQQRHPVPRVGDGELMEWLDKKPVEDQEGGNRSEHCGTTAETNGGRQHGQQVQHRCVGQVDLAQYDADEDADYGYGSQGKHVARQPATPHVNHVSSVTRGVSIKTQQNGAFAYERISNPDFEQTLTECPALLSTL